MPTADGPTLELPFRPCVGIMLFSRHGLVWVGRRRPKWAAESVAPFWQMPQGGINANEAPEQTVLRELYEETGISSAEIVATIPDWLTYELPDYLLGVALKGRYRGQHQRWFAVQFTGLDSEINIRPKNGQKAEFDAWQWASMDEVPRLVTALKRPLYETVVREFAHLAR